MAVPLMATYVLTIIWGAAFTLFVLGWAVAALYGGHWKQLLIVVPVGIACGLATMGLAALLSDSTGNMIAGFLVGFGGPAATTAGIMILVNFVKWLRARASRRKSRAEQGLEEDTETNEGRKAAVRLGLPIVIGSALLWYVFVPIVSVTMLVFAIGASESSKYEIQSHISVLLVFYLAVECQLALVRYVFGMGVLYARSFARHGTVVLGWMTVPLALLGLALPVLAFRESDPSYYLATVSGLLFLLLAFQAFLAIRIGRRPALKQYCAGDHRVDDDASRGLPESRDSERSGTISEG